jgi:Na+-transporting methylmalonyl-CoA/oxaloacetate decarboxylase gamma subunit
MSIPAACALVLVATVLTFLLLLVFQFPLFTEVSGRFAREPVMQQSEVGFGSSGIAPGFTVLSNALAWPIILSMRGKEIKEGVVTV